MLKQYPDVLTVDQLCQVLQISKKLAYKLLSEQAIPSRKIGRSYRISKQEVLKFIQK